MIAIMKFLPWIQVVLAVLLIIGILIQNGGAGLEGALGGGDTMSEGPSHTRRGAEKGIFKLTIIIALLFLLSAVLPLFIQ